MCDAACVSYDFLMAASKPVPIIIRRIRMVAGARLRSRSWICSKCPTSLSKYTLQPEEESLLARQIILKQLPPQGAPYDGFFRRYRYIV